VDQDTGIPVYGSVYQPLFRKTLWLVGMSENQNPRELQVREYYLGAADYYAEVSRKTLFTVGDLVRLVRNWPHGKLYTRLKDKHLMVNGFQVRQGKGDKYKHGEDPPEDGMDHLMVNIAPHVWVPYFSVRLL
jgi:hypothetical protein